VAAALKNAALVTPWRPKVDDWRSVRTGGQWGGLLWERGCDVRKVKGGSQWPFYALWGERGGSRARCAKWRKEWGRDPANDHRRREASTSTRAAGAGRRATRVDLPSKIGEGSH
jgi:hypothetical protein